MIDRKTYNKKKSFSKVIKEEYLDELDKYGKCKIEIKAQSKAHKQGLWIECLWKKDGDDDVWQIPPWIRKKPDVVIMGNENRFFIFYMEDLKNKMSQMMRLNKLKQNSKGTSKGFHLSLQECEDLSTESY